MVEAKEAAQECFLAFLHGELEGKSGSREGNIVEKILEQVIEILKRRCGVFANSHALAAALHNLGCFYAGQHRIDNDADRFGESLETKAMTMCSRALIMRRSLLEDGDRVSFPDTPRDKERDERAVGESLNDIGVLNVMRASKEPNLKRRDAGLVKGENFVREAKAIFDRVHHFLHPVCIIMLRNLAWVRKARGYRSEACDLLREALSRARLALSTNRSRTRSHLSHKDRKCHNGLSNRACLVIDCCLDLVSMCFRHPHLTNEARSCLREALRVNQEAFPESHHFESMRILHMLSQLHFSRRRYRKARHWNKSAQKMAHKVKPSLQARMQIMEINNDIIVIEERIKCIENAEAQARQKLLLQEQEEEAKAMLMSGQNASKILNPKLEKRPKSAAAGVSGRNHNKSSAKSKKICKQPRRPKSALVTRTITPSGKPNKKNKSQSRLQRKKLKRSSPNYSNAHRQVSLLQGTTGGSPVDLSSSHNSPLSKSMWFQGKAKVQNEMWLARDEDFTKQKRIEERKAKEVHWVHARHQERLAEMQRIMEQQSTSDYQYNRDAAILRRSVYVSPTDPPVKLIKGVTKNIEGEKQDRTAQRRPENDRIRAKSASVMRRHARHSVQKHHQVRTINRKRPVSSSPSAKSRRGNSRSYGLMWISAPTVNHVIRVKGGAGNSFKREDRGDSLFPEPSVNSNHGDLANHILHSM